MDAATHQAYLANVAALNGSFNSSSVDNAAGGFDTWVQGINPALSTADAAARERNGLTVTLADNRYNTHDDSVYTTYVKTLPGPTRTIKRRSTRPTASTIKPPTRPTPTTHQAWPWPSPAMARRSRTPTRTLPARWTLRSWTTTRPSPGPARRTRPTSARPRRVTTRALGGYTQTMEEYNSQVGTNRCELQFSHRPGRRGVQPRHGSGWQRPRCRAADLRRHNG